MTALSTAEYDALVDLARRGEIQNPAHTSAAAGVEWNSSITQTQDIGWLRGGGLGQHDALGLLPLLAALTVPRDLQRAVRAEFVRFMLAQGADSRRLPSQSQQEIRLLAANNDVEVTAASHRDVGDHDMRSVSNGAASNEARMDLVGLWTNINGISSGVWGRQIVIEINCDAKGIGAEGVVVWNGHLTMQADFRFHFRCLNTEHNSFPNIHYECSGALDSGRLKMYTGGPAVEFAKVSVGPSAVGVPGYPGGTRAEDAASESTPGSVAVSAVSAEAPPPPLLSSVTRAVVASRAVEKLLAGQGLDCIICMNEKRNIVCCGCGHFNSCVTCTWRLAQSGSKCPTCRQGVPVPGAAILVEDVLQVLVNAQSGGQQRPVTLSENAYANVLSILEPGHPGIFI